MKEKQENQKSGKVQVFWAAVKWLYQSDSKAFLASTSIGMMEALFYPLLLLIGWRGFSLVLTGGERGHILFQEVIVLFEVLLIGLIVQQLLKMIKETAVSFLKAKSSQQINMQLMSKLSEAPYQFFEDNSFQARYGLLISHAVFRPGMLVEALSSTLGSLISFLSIMVALLVLAPLLVILLLVLIPLIAVEGRFHNRTIQLQTSSAPELFRMQYLAQKNIDATWQRDIRIHNSSVLHEEYRLLGHSYLRHLKRLLRRFQAIRTAVGIGASALITLGAVATFWLIIQGRLGTVEVGMLLPVLFLGLTQGKGLSTAWGSLVECLGYIGQVFDFLNQSFERSHPTSSLPAVPTWRKVDTLPEGEMTLQLHAVSYSYPQTDKVALSEISYTFSTGTTAIVGPNGTGKSTLVKLLAGLLTPTSGTIRVQLPGGKCLTPEQLHKGVLFQEPSHLYLTIRQNITMRFERTTGEEAGIYEALEKAGLGEVVKSLPDGIDTLVGAGFGGQTDLSGGQWQRLALARLIYQNAPVIILDEPVASLDPKGERAVFELFSQLAQSRIIIFTTHRYDSIPKNTRIVVLVDGIITESGTHEELLRKHQDYWSLYRTATDPSLEKAESGRMAGEGGQLNV